MAFAVMAGVADGATAWEKVPGGRHAEANPGPAVGGRSAGLTRMTPEQTGIGFTNELPQWRHRTNQILLNGSGVAAGDVDGDGLCDVYFCGLQRPNALYRNLGGWRFQDVAAEAGVSCEGLTSTGAALADFDGDGDLDLLVNSVGHGTRLFMNDGKGKFGLAGVLNANKGGMSMALGDLNGDGYLDLYLTNYRTLALMDMPNTRFHFAVVNGQRVVSRVNGRPATEPDLLNRYRVNGRGGIEENGESDEVYFNVGGSGLQPVPFTTGAFLDEDGRPLAETPVDWGLSVMIRDLNQDGRPDIWVCNDFDTPDRVWLNQGKGVFRAASRLAFRKTSHFAMGVDVADINRDGWDDIFVVDMLSRDQVMRMDMMGDRNPPVPLPGVWDNRPDYMINTLFLNGGDGHYAELAQLAGVAATEWSWTPAFLDVDLDGYEDLLVANGHERAARSIDVSERLRALRSGRQLSADEIFDNRRMFPRQNSPNLAFRNRGDLTFEDVSGPWGFDFDGVSHGLALADLDNDGDQDVLVNNLNGRSGVYRNDATAPRLAVRLRGQTPNTHGVGARITVRAAGLPEQSQEVLSGGRYLSSDAPERSFAAGPSNGPVTIVVEWPAGRRSVIEGARGNRIYEIEEASAVRWERPARSGAASPPVWFEDASARLQHRHHEELFDDFGLQPLLLERLSQLGPGVTWADFDGDGREDLVVGSGRGGATAFLRNTGERFERQAGGGWDEVSSRDQTSILPWGVPGAGSGLRFVAGAASYEDGNTNEAAGRVYDVAGRTVRDLLPGGPASVGPLAMGDLDGDGQLDLFAGARVVPGRFPESGPSRLWRGTADGWGADATNAAVLRDLGQVSGAVFSDLDGDGDLDVVVACDWGSLRFLRNERGGLTVWDPPVQRKGGGVPTTFGTLVGRWQGVTTVDVDGDGRQDIVASNWGRNSRWETYFNRGAGAVELAHGDFDGNGVVDLMEVHRDARSGKMVPERQLDMLARGMPFLKERFQSNLEFGRLGLEEILGPHAASARRIRLTCFESTVFLNRGDRWEERPLPVEAQFSPSFGVTAGDFDLDGRMDLFLAQNFFSSLPDTPRLDAGWGLILAGDGAGGFRAVPARESGVRLPGEQRGAAVGDFDGDGRLDLAVAQNGGQTALWRNVGRSQAGLRVRLKGEPGNPRAVGAVVRARRGEAMGPAVEIHGGSGYWSHDSAVLVLAGVGGAAPVELWVRWPGGRVTTVAVPAGARTVELEAVGGIRAVER